jgi:hypothetical protein
MLLFAIMAPLTALAAVSTDPEQGKIIDEIPVEILSANNVTIFRDWTTVRTAPTSNPIGINRNIGIRVFNHCTSQVNDIRMLGRNGQIVWQENNTIGNAGQRIFWCGPDVYTIQLRYRIVGYSPWPAHLHLVTANIWNA